MQNFSYSHLSVPVVYKYSCEKKIQRHSENKTISLPENDLSSHLALLAAAGRGEADASVASILRFAARRT